MTFRNPAQMTPDEIVGEIRDLRTGVEKTANRIYELSQALRHRIKRSSLRDEESGIYVAYANIWTRFAGMVSQGLSRTAQGDRVLKLLPSNKEDAPVEVRKVKEAEPTPQKHEAFEGVFAATPIDSLLEMYGGEPVSDAETR